MTSQKQIDANRRNALKSTGPNTTEGKAAVRLNALRHGLRARTVVLPDENADEFHRLCADLESEFRPQSRAEQILVEEMAVSHWKLARLEIGERAIYKQSIPAKDQMALIAQLSLYEARLKRSFIKALRELEHMQKKRCAAAAPVEPVEPKPAPERPASASPAFGGAPPPSLYIMNSETPSALPFARLEPMLSICPDWDSRYQCSPGARR